MQLLNQTIAINLFRNNSSKKDSKKPKKVTYPPGCKCENSTKGWRVEIGRDGQISTPKAVRLCS